MKRFYFLFFTFFLNPLLLLTAEAEDVTEEITAAEAGITQKNILIRIGLAVIVVIAMLLLLKLAARLFEKLRDKIDAKRCGGIFKPFVLFKKYTLLETDQIINIVRMLQRSAKYLVFALIVYLSLTVIFGLFEQTREFALKLIGYIINPLKNTAISIAKYIPNLFTIIVTVVISQFALKALKIFRDQIEKGKLKISGFHEDWAQPTFNILRILIYAFTLILIFPFLPNSESNIFKGVSVFIGILFSLGSSSVIGNLVAGIVVTYMRPFQLGDRIKIGGVIGFVVEKSATVTRLRTHKNEYVTFPNLTVLTSSITNYSVSASNENEKGLILYTEITFGYSTPWQTVHELLINAALQCEYVERDPMPFVLQTKLNDFYAHYELNIYTKHVPKVPSVYSELHKNIQNAFRDAGLDMTAPHFYIRPPSAEEQVLKELEEAKENAGR